MRNLFLILFISIQIVSVEAQSIDSIATALQVIGLSFDSSEIDSMRDRISDYSRAMKITRQEQLQNDVPFSLLYNPPLNHNKLNKEQIKLEWDTDLLIKRPDNISDIAFYSIPELASLIKHKKVSSLELTHFFINRLRAYGDTLQCVITITDSLAIAQANKADREIAKGNYRGPLHGIPYGVKDLLSVKDYKTTWGAQPFKDQYLDKNATVVQKLEEAGAVLVAKLTLGALAMGDVWYGGKTKNPWNLKQGSSGSSAGSASATVAGLVPFAIGSETMGSIVSPSTRCGATGLRPTFGRVSRHGAMTLSWSMDKLGPICRSAEDCAIVFNAIRGEDKLDLTVKEFPFNYDTTVDIKELKIGILQNEFSSTGFNFQNDSILLNTLKSKGINLIDKEFVSPIPALTWSIILGAESAAAFDDLSLSNADDQLVRQSKNAWPNYFRAARLIPAVEYIQANRHRHVLTLEFNKLMKDIDVLIAPSFGPQLYSTNLTGHPCVVLPNGSYANQEPGSITLIGNHFDEASILLFAKYIQEITDFNKEHPALFKE